MLNKIENYKFVLFNDSYIQRFNRDYIIALYVDGEEETNIPSLFSMPMEDVPAFLDAAINSNEWGYRYGGFFKGPCFEEREQPDEEDLDIKADEVQISDRGANPYPKHRYEEIKLELFYRITIDYAHKCLEAVTWYGLKEKGIVTDEWVEKVKSWILKVENDPSLTKYVNQTI